MMACAQEFVSTKDHEGLRYCEECSPFTSLVQAKRAFRTRVRGNLCCRRNKITSRNDSSEVDRGGRGG